MTSSAIYQGQVRHRRKTPVEHEFSYRMFMMYLDLAELPGLFRGRWFWSATRPALARFRREDHFGDPCDTAGRGGQRPGSSETGSVPAALFAC